MCISEFADKNSANNEGRQYNQIGVVIISQKKKSQSKYISDLDTTTPHSSNWNEAGFELMTTHRVWLLLIIWGAVIATVTAVIDLRLAHEHKKIFYHLYDGNR